MYTACCLFSNRSNVGWLLKLFNEVSLGISKVCTINKMFIDDSKCNKFIFKTPFVIAIFCHHAAFTEVIKRRELAKNEMRPLYMDFQATTPMGSILYNYQNTFLRRIHDVYVK